LKEGTRAVQGPEEELKGFEQEGIGRKGVWLCGICTHKYKMNLEVVGKKVMFENKNAF
jgi:hypothetical protein